MEFSISKFNEKKSIEDQYRDYRSSIGNLTSDSNENYIRYDLKAEVGEGYFKNIKYRDIRFDKGLFKTILSYSLLTSLQQSISSFGMLMVQGLVNTFGSTIMAAYAACSKVDEFANRPLQDLANTFSTYTAQNEGAKKFDRIEEGFKLSLRLILGISLIISLVAYRFAPNLIGVFISKDSVEIIEIGVKYLRRLSIFYFLMGIVIMYYSFFRGLGEMKISIILTILSQFIRVSLSYVLAKTSLGFQAIPISIIIGWFISSIIGFYFHRSIIKDRRTYIESLA